MPKKYVKICGVHVDEEIQTQVMEKYFPKLHQAIRMNSNNLEVNESHTNMNKSLELFHSALENTLLRSGYNKGRLFLKASRQGFLYYNFGIRRVDRLYSVSLAFSEMTGNFIVKPEIYLGLQEGISRLYVNNLSMVVLSPSLDFQIKEYDLQFWCKLDNLLKKRLDGVFRIIELPTLRELMSRRDINFFCPGSGHTRCIELEKDFCIDDDEDQRMTYMVYIDAVSKLRQTSGTSELTTPVRGVNMSYVGPLHIKEAASTLCDVSTNEFVVNAAKFVEIKNAPIQRERELIKELRNIKKANQIGSKSFYKFVKDSLLESRDTAMEDIYAIPEVVNVSIDDQELILHLDLENDFIITDSKGRAIVRYKPGLGYDNIRVTYNFINGTLKSSSHSLFHAPLQTPACLGGYQTDIVEAAMDRDHVQLTKLIVQYLSFRNSDDSRGNITYGEGEFPIKMQIEDIIKWYKTKTMFPFIQILTEHGWLSSTEMYTKDSQRYKKCIRLIENEYDTLTLSIMFPGRSQDHRRSYRDFVHGFTKINEDLKDNDPDYQYVNHIISKINNRIESIGLRYIGGVSSYWRCLKNVSEEDLPSFIRIFEEFYNHSEEFPLLKSASPVSTYGIDKPDADRLRALYVSLGIDEKEED